MEHTMNATVVHKKTKVSELLVYLIKNPQHIGSYFSKCLLTAENSFEQQVPWIALPAIEFLDSYLNDSMEVFEYGAGGSTLYYAKKVKSVISIENDEKWVELVESSLKKEGLNNVQLVYKNIAKNSDRDFQQCEYLQALKNTDKFDVIAIDGAEIANFKARPICFNLAEKHVKPGGIIIVDDAWRYESLHENNNALRVREFYGIGPSRKGLTKTDIYFY